MCKPSRSMSCWATQICLAWSRNLWLGDKEIHYLLPRSLKRSKYNFKVGVTSNSRVINVTITSKLSYESLVHWLKEPRFWQSRHPPPVKIRQWYQKHLKSSYENRASIPIQAQLDLWISLDMKTVITALRDTNLCDECHYKREGDTVGDLRCTVYISKVTSSKDFK